MGVTAINNLDLAFLHDLAEANREGLKHFGQVIAFSQSRRMHYRCKLEEHGIMKSAHDTSCERRTKLKHASVSRMPPR